MGSGNSLVSMTRLAGLYIDSAVAAIKKGGTVDGVATEGELKTFCKTDLSNNKDFDQDILRTAKETFCVLTKDEAKQFFPFKYWNGIADSKGRTLAADKTNLRPSLIVADIIDGNGDGTTTQPELIEYRYNLGQIVCVYILAEVAPDLMAVVKRCSWQDTPEGILFDAALKIFNPSLSKQLQIEFDKRYPKVDGTPLLKKPEPGLDPLKDFEKYPTIEI